MPTISIILPCYKAEGFVANIVQDVSAQTFTDWQLIAVSNGPDQQPQLDILQELQSQIGKDKLFILSAQEAGVSNARNMGIEHAQAPWLCFVDADDRIKPNHLQVLFEATKTGEPEIVIGGHVTYKAVNNTYKEERCCEEEILIGKRGIAELSLFAREVVWSRLYNTAFINNHQLRYDCTYALGEDTIFMHQCLLFAERVKLIPSCTYIYTSPDAVAGKSAASRFQPLNEEMRIKEKGYYCELLRQGGFSEEQVQERSVQVKCSHTACLLHNLFRPGNPFTLSQRRAHIKRLLFDDPEM